MTFLYLFGMHYSLMLLFVYTFLFVGLFLCTKCVALPDHQKSVYCEQLLKIGVNNYLSVSYCIYCCWTFDLYIMCDIHGLVGFCSVTFFF